MSKAWRLALALLSFGAVFSDAAETKFGGLIFGQWGMYTTKRDSTGADARGRSEAQISRIYLTGEGKFNEKLKGNIIIEGNTIQTNDTGHGSNSVFLKQAFGDYALTDKMNLIFGQIGTPWIGYEEEIWGHRYVQKVQVDQEFILSPADKGIGFLGKLPRGFGDFSAAALNGEGMTTREAALGDGRYKDVMARVSITPVPDPIAGFGDISGLKFHAYAQQGRAGSGGMLRRDRFMGAVSYQCGRGHLMYTYTTGINGDGFRNEKLHAYSVHGSVKLPWKLGAFARWDRYAKAETYTAAGVFATFPESMNRGIVGMDYVVADGVRVALSDQWLTPIKPEGTSTAATKLNRANENQLLAQFEMKF